MTDRTDNLIEALVACREHGMSRAACHAIVRDVFDTEWIVPPPTAQEVAEYKHALDTLCGQLKPEQVAALDARLDRAQREFEEDFPS
jgi:hypothetical protein